MNILVNTSVFINTILDNLFSELIKHTYIFNNVKHILF